MGDFSSLIVENASGTHVPELIRAIADYSYVLHAKDIPSLRDGDNLVADFDLGAGSWIVWAKATARAPGGDDVLDLQLTLTATEKQSVQIDRAKASTTNLHYATMNLLLGTRFVTAGKVRLVALPSGPRRDGELIHIVLAAVKIDKLFVWNL